MKGCIMRTDRRKSQKRKRAVRKRFFAFLTTIDLTAGTKNSTLTDS
jgi:hypothetical protein